jgi:hypothetical protein
MTPLLILLAILALANACGKSAPKDITQAPERARPPETNDVLPTEMNSGQPTVTPTPEATTMETTESKGVVVVSGIFDHAGENLISLKPARRYNWRSRPIPEQSQGRFLVKVEYTNGEATIVPFDALVADDAGRTWHGFFEVTVPLKGKIASIRITDTSGRKQFALIKASEIQP